MRARWNIVDYALAGISVDAWGDPYSTTETAGRSAGARRSPPGRRPALRAEHRAELLDFASRAEKLDRRQLAEGALPGAAPERAAAADRRQPGPDPAMSPSRPTHNCCDNYTRSQLLQSAAAEAGSGLPAIEPGMPEPAGTGLSRRKFLLAQRRPGAGRLRRLEDPALGLRDGDRAGGPGRQAPRLGLLRRRRRRAQRAGPGRRPAIREPAAEPGAGAKATGPRSPRTPACAGTRPPPASRPCTARARSRVFPAIGYDHPDQSHFTSRHYYEIGELEIGCRTGWLGRYIDSVGDEENPLQGLSMDGALSPMIATADKPVAAIDSVDGYDLWSAVSDPVRAEMYKSFAKFGAMPSDSPGDVPGPARHRPDRQAAPGPRRRRRLHQPGRLPEHPLLPQAGRARRLHRRRAADAGGDDPRRRRLRHPRRPGRRPRAQPARNLRRACSPSSATSKRAASPTGC